MHSVNGSVCPEYLYMDFVTARRPYLRERHLDTWKNGLWILLNSKRVRTADPPECTYISKRTILYNHKKPHPLSAGLIAAYLLNKCLRIGGLTGDIEQWENVCEW